MPPPPQSTLSRAHRRSGAFTTTQPTQRHSAPRRQRLAKKTAARAAAPALSSAPSPACECSITTSSRASSIVASTLAAALLALSATCTGAWTVPPAQAEEGELSISFGASADPAIRQAQKTLVESWAYVDTLFVDSAARPHEQWAQALQDALAASFKATDAQGVTTITDELLASLGDPFTRLLQPGSEEAAVLQAEQEGKIVATGLGLQRAQELLAVSFVVQGSPAEAAGVQEGDVLLEVNGQGVEGKELRQVYKLLAQDADVTLARQLLPRLSSSDSSSSSDPVVKYSARLKPAPLEFEPVQYGVIELARLAGEQQPGGVDSTPDSTTPDSTSVSPTGQVGQVGYLKILTFSATAPQEVADALREMQQQQGGLRGLVVDMRDNPGGIVEAGVDIAQNFLHAGQTLCIAADKTGIEERVALPEAHTLTELPLVVLVNHGTASTSELLAGALRDELHAPLIGTATFGKGRTQRVIPLSDGVSTLLLSTMRYATPANTPIDAVGLAPDVVCDPEPLMGERWRGGSVGEEESASLLDDPCIRLAAQRLAQ